MNILACDWGASAATRCHVPATWNIFSEKLTFELHACDTHAPRMARASDARRLPTAPALAEPVFRAYVTALAWESYLGRGGPRERALSAKFQQMRADYARQFRRPVRTVPVTDHGTPAPGQ